MSDGNETISSLISTWTSGAVSTLVGATIGRLMYHAGEVRKMKRKPLDASLVWELPVAVGMGMMADGVASYFGVDRSVSTAISVGFGYLGPGGVQAIFAKWFEKQKAD